MRASVLVAVVGCSFAPRAAPDGSAQTGDGAPACFDADGVTLHVCLASAPAGATTVATATADTSGLLAPCAPLAPDSDRACAIAGASIAIPAGVTLSAQGTAPLVLIATGDITVDGTIDVASHVGGRTGPMANAGCPPQTVLGQAGGGAGGSYGTIGGDGGDGAGPTQMNVHGLAAMPMTIGLHGGCNGGDGGETNHPNNTGGPGGPGGGVVVLIAGGTITIAGSIDASGAGGHGAPMGNTRGGGGGGAGGLVVLDASHAMGSGQVFANGGGGGGGTSTAQNGSDGEDPADASTRPAGGDPFGNAGAGGDGYHAGTAAAMGDMATNPTDGGGGGGGAAGIIHTPGSAQLAGLTFSPPVTH